MTTHLRGDAFDQLKGLLSQAVPVLDGDAERCEMVTSICLLAAQIGRRETLVTVLDVMALAAQADPRSDLDDKA